MPAVRLIPEQFNATALVQQQPLPILPITAIPAMMAILVPPAKLYNAMVLALVVQFQAPIKPV
jgi:hypothetical protein